MNFPMTIFAKFSSLWFCCNREDPSVTNSYSWCISIQFTLKPYGFIRPQTFVIRLSSLSLSWVCRHNGFHAITCPSWPTFLIFFTPYINDFWYGIKVVIYLGVVTNYLSPNKRLISVFCFVCVGEFIVHWFSMSFY